MTRVRRALHSLWTPPRFHWLADYNAEAARGVPHSEWSRQRAATLDRQYTKWRAGHRDWHEERAQ